MATQGRDDRRIRAQYLIGCRKWQAVPQEVQILLNVEADDVNLCVLLIAQLKTCAITSADFIFLTLENLLGMLQFV